MIEYYTDALVLDKESRGELDGLAILYTKDLGKVVARAKSLKKITSKLAGHLEPLNFVKVRLVEKNGFQAVDALTVKVNKGIRKDAAKLAKFLRIADFIKEMTFECQTDHQLWRFIKKMFDSDFEEKAAYRFLLRIFGFDSAFAACVLCRKKPVKFFNKKEPMFFCGQCGEKIWKNKGDEIISII